ncbi:MAG: (deoxy)nucleoside triphosphate pyrophosphohydrolase [Novosphingobium sp.]
MVAAALLNNDGKILVQKRKADGAHGGLWEFPGGKLEPGESPESGLIRELVEELGIRLEADSLEWVASSSEPADPDQARKPIVIELYTCRTWQGEPQCLDAQQLGWFAPAELAGLNMPPLDVDMIPALLRAI